ncbi:MAG: hypothetical protein L6435_09400, partial [Anaerolineae bacterium]|nr:hypothetical protein [Anaerolineae bacterium]
WTPLGLGLAALGLGLFAVRGKEKPALPFAAASMMCFVIYAVNPLVNAVQPWASRRLVPVVLPALAVFAAYAVVNLPPVRFRLHRVAQILAVVTLAGLFVRAEWPFLRRVEYRGCFDSLTDLAGHFEKDSLILLDRNGPGENVAQPLHYLFGLNTFVLQKEQPDTEVLRPFLHQWWQAEKPVYLILSGASLSWYPTDIALVPEESVVFSLPVTERARGRLPSREQSWHLHFDIYRLEPVDYAQDPGQSLPTRLEMADGEYPYLRGGLHRGELAPDGTTFRWTDGATRLILGAPVADEATLRLRVSGGREGDIEPPALSVWANGVLVGQTQMDGSHAFEVLEFPLPSELMGELGGSPSVRRLEVELHSDTWIPMSVTGSTDPRTLGVAVDWIEVEGAK